MAGRHILAIQDTTTLRDDGNQRSLNLHPTISVDAEDGTLFGLLHAALLSRDGSAAKVHCNKRPFAEKESRRWLDATIASAALLAAGARAVTVVGDREGDIYEDFALRPPEVDVLYRAHHDRVLADGTTLFSKPSAGRNWAGKDRHTGGARPAGAHRGTGVACRCGDAEAPQAQLRGRGGEAAAR